MAADTSDLSIRTATEADIETILRHRRDMFLDMGYPDNDALARAMALSRSFIADRLAQGNYHGWFVVTPAGEVVAGGGLYFSEPAPSPRDPSPKRPIIVNMYTERPYRRRGLARRLMEVMIAWCRNQGFGSILLQASSEGRPLYEKLGFKQTNEMRMMLR